MESRNGTDTSRIMQHLQNPNQIFIRIGLFQQTILKFYAIPQEFWTIEKLQAVDYSIFEYLGLLLTKKCYYPGGATIAMYT